MSSDDDGQAYDQDQDDEHGVDLVPVEPEVVEAEVVTEDEYRSLRAVAVVRNVATHPRSKAVLRQALYVTAGISVLVRRLWDARTTARYERMIRGAELAGDHAGALEWEARGAAFRKDRHQRRMDMLAFPAKAAINLPKVLLGLLAVELVIGVSLAVADRSLHEVATPILVTAYVVRTVVIVAAIAWGPLVLVTPWMAVLALWQLGRTKGTIPAGLAIADPARREIVPDEGAILAALRHLGIAALNKAVKDGWQPRWILAPHLVGEGYHAQLQLPQGVNVEAINARKPLLASNLMRLPVEVWPTEPRNQPAVLDLYVAHQGSLSGKVADYPLLTSGTADYFKGVPVGVSQRGDPVIGQLMARNYMIGGIMGTGKSSATRNLLLGAMLDPLVDIDVYVMAFNADYDAMRPRLRTFVMGDDDEQIYAALQALRDLRDEVTARGKILVGKGGDEFALTREQAKRDTRMRPRVVVFDEVHELFEHKTYGEEAAELAIKVLKKARKCGITLIFVTVSPTAASIPKDVTRNTSNRVAFAVGDHVANDGLLGTGKHSAGITATTLNPGEDIGTALTVGFTRNPFELVRMYFVEKSTNTDEISPVVTRALAGYLHGANAAIESGETERADALADIADALGDESRVRTEEVVHRLKNLNAAEYRDWTTTDLASTLTPFGAAPYKSNGVMVVARQRVIEALADRDDQRGGGQGGDGESGSSP